MCGDAYASGYMRAGRCPGGINNAAAVAARDPARIEFIAASLGVVSKTRLRHDAAGVGQLAGPERERVRDRPAKLHYARRTAGR